jgi:hypothetical protein
MAAIAASEGALFTRCVLMNSSVTTVWRAWESLKLPDCWIVAGCLAQTVWNSRSGLPADHAISDLDLVYFDREDMSASTERKHAERIRHMFSQLSVWIDVKNEARVHLWYEAKFGKAIEPHTSVMDAIDSFPTTATTIGIRPSAAGAEVYATFGLSDLFAGIVRPNKRLITRDVYEAKASKWRDYWPDLTVISWDED